MSRVPAAAYRSTTDEVVTAYRELEEERTAWRKKAFEYGESIGRHVRIVSSVYFDDYVVGLENLRDVPPPAGWRKRAKDDYITPGPKPRGKVKPPEYMAALQTIVDLKAPAPRAEMEKRFGLPMTFWSNTDQGDGTRLAYAPGLELIEGALYVTWGTDEIDWTGGEHFERMSLSDYFAMIGK